MTTMDRAAAPRIVYSDVTGSPPASIVVPSVFVAVRWLGGRLLLVRRCDSGAWELPGGCVDVGETACETAVRETAAEAGVRVLVTGLAGVFSDPAYVVETPGGEARQVLALLFRARAIGGVPHGDRRVTSDAAWVALADLRGLAIAPPMWGWIEQALDVHADPLLS
jgi:8-oxo-dGTP diphosphatase